MSSSRSVFYFHVGAHGYALLCSIYEFSAFSNTALHWAVIGAAQSSCRSLLFQQNLVDLLHKYCTVSGSRGVAVAKLFTRNENKSKNLNLKNKNITKKALIFLIKLFWMLSQNNNCNCKQQQEQEQQFEYLFNKQ